MIIEPAKKSDAKNCLRISNDPAIIIDKDDKSFCADEKYFKDATEKGIFLIAKENSQDKKIIGIIIGFLISKDDCFLDLLVVDKEIRGKGIGSKLLKAFKIELTARGGKDYFLFAPANNKKTIDFYKKQGLSGGKKKFVAFYERL